MPHKDPKISTIYKQRWRNKLSPYRKAQYRKNAREQSRERSIKLRQAILDKLGYKCANPDCRWLNEDGTLGCKNKLILQIDHVNGGGTKESAALSPQVLLKKVLNDTSDSYQLLCANCNWLKRERNKENSKKHLLP